MLYRLKTNQKGLNLTRNLYNNFIMANFIVKGGKKLQGEVTVSGSKNAALPIICASLLSNEKVILENIPDIEDVRSMIKIITALGAKTSFENNVLEIDSSKVSDKEIPNEMVTKMRASILILGGLLPRTGKVKMQYPGGCVLGKRSVDAHTHAFKELGCEVIDDQKGIDMKCKILKGKKIILPELSVTATENAIMASVLAQGETEIRLAACEPHVQDLCEFLNKRGAKIKGIGTNVLRIKGVKKLKKVKYRITGDYLEAGTMILAAAATGGSVLVKGFNTNDLDSLWQKLEEVGVPLTIEKDNVKVNPATKLEAVRTLRTAVFPSFPTDLQAPFAVLLTQAHGVSKVFETLFEGRLNYTFELEKMGAKINLLNPHQVLISGPTPLKGMAIASCDIRAGAAMIIAALTAKGTTEISNINYIDRGYEKIEEKLRSLGAEIERI
ncbi:UDP-N-acetylglucosamine 1-carboxyvinyltransferase [Candidatus Peregrinibacteria bacterium CG_4_10_14_0_2_um_filter_38_24]|nr:MAG: UDP-N-acetylglucosamine 1-carboxyvinyltransferase [Candidatus Peregrinibacteria bacterium CG_4_10_14_0_2_um_filter_38_24]PJC38742.1 MAG: UDP-N-acetylglucosamine 1-carboxyvinyltransferase [Candidatus Peregrinibacteria bacterium CG_4_9_14_0_2_um_filter_38_9]